MYEKISTNIRVLGLIFSQMDIGKTEFSIIERETIDGVNFYIGFCIIFCTCFCLCFWHIITTAPLSFQHFNLISQNFYLAKLDTTFKETQNGSKPYMQRFTQSALMVFNIFLRTFAFIFITTLKFKI